MKCKICAAPTVEFASATVMGSHLAHYRQCSECGFVFVENPAWLAEAYESPINRTDLGPVNRAVSGARSVKAVIETFFSWDGQFLDYGSGYGLFVRLMRDSGYAFVGYDKHCVSLFDEDFRLSSLDGRQFELVTSFEVLEHLPDPMEVFDHIFAHTDNILFTTELLPSPAPLPGSWWYYALDHGQHVSFYSVDALRHAASRFGMHFRSTGQSLHLISKKPVRRTLFRWVTGARIAAILELARKRRSLLPGDWEGVRLRVLSSLADTGSLKSCS
jgi:hypothetical protein